MAWTTVSMLADLGPAQRESLIHSQSRALERVDPVTRAEYAGEIARILSALTAEGKKTAPHLDSISSIQGTTA